MKCAACNNDYPLSKWRTLNFNISGNNVNSQITRTNRTLAKNPINYYTPRGRSQYSNVYACPNCGTLRVKTPTDSVK